VVSSSRDTGGLPVCLFPKREKRIREGKKEVAEPRVGGNRKEGGEGWSASAEKKRRACFSSGGPWYITYILSGRRRGKRGRSLGERKKKKNVLGEIEKPSYRPWSGERSDGLLAARVKGIWL